MGLHLSVVDGDQLEKETRVFIHEQANTPNPRNGTA
jgi:hypothetical protein